MPPTTLTTLITPEQLAALLAGATPPVLLDCGFDLADPGAGERAYATGHLPGAHYAHLDRDLCGKVTGDNGRHPLPDRAAMASTAARWGIAPGVQVVAYDAQGGPYAARAWWLLRWIGHDAVAVLDGGLQAWRARGGALATAPARAHAAPPYPMPVAPGMPAVDAEALAAMLGRATVVDARAPERFRGEVEPIDKVAGRIPGTQNRFFKDNLDPEGRFRPAAELRAVFEALGAAPQATVHLCGSGVTACHNVLAMAHAGMPGSALYAGSWSEWCADPARPVARG